MAAVHRLPGRDSYCKLDEVGNLVDVVTIEKRGDWYISTVDSKALDPYLFLTDQVLVRVFEVQRSRHVRHFWEPDLREEHILREDLGLYARRVLRGMENSPQAGLVRGAQVVRISESPEQLMKVLRGERSEEKRYESFLIHDWKHDKVIEWACDPDQLGNYFVPSDLPFETSPAFFRPEVLAKYKQDPDKYTLTDTSISCRGAWHLQRYGLNDAGQVFTYIVYLGHLPHSEQLYWRSFNEPPKAGLPERVIATDFRGEWAEEADPLEQLRHLLRKFPDAEQKGRRVPVWTLGSRDAEELLRRLHYVMTDSHKEWADEILNLEKVVIEGLQKKAIKNAAESLGCYDPMLGSIKLLRASLTAAGVDAEVVQEVCDPPIALHEVRSKNAAHLGAGYITADPKADFRQRVAEINDAMHRLAELVRTGVLNVT